MVDVRRRPKGEGSIHFRADKRLWVGSFDLGRDGTGKRVRRTLYGKSRPELQRKIADLKAVGGGTVRPRAKGTVGEFVARWLEEDVKPNRATNTYVLYESMWRVHAAPIIGGIKLEQFDVEHVSALYSHLRSAGRSSSVIHRVGVIMHRVIAVAIRRREYGRANPFDAIERPTHRAKKMRSLTVEEARRFLRAAEGDRFEALWVLCLTAGLRLGEVLALRWIDVDFEIGTAAISRTLVEIGGALMFGDPKTAGSRRLVALGTLARQALLRRLAARDAEAHDSELVFTTPTGLPMRRSNLRRSHFAPVLRAAGLPHIRIHDLRHSMTSLGVAAGVQPKVLADRLGHSTTRLTQDRYAHVLPGIGQGAAVAIDELLADR